MEFSTLVLIFVYLITIFLAGFEFNKNLLKNKDKHDKVGIVILYITAIYLCIIPIINIFIYLDLKFFKNSRGGC